MSTSVVVEGEWRWPARPERWISSPDDKLLEGVVSTSDAYVVSEQRRPDGKRIGLDVQVARRSNAPGGPRLAIWAALGVPVLAGLNVGSVTLYLVACWALRMGRERLAFRLAWFEVLVHGMVAVHQIGWAAGLQQPILLVAVFVGSGTSRREHLAMVMLVIVSMIAASQLGPPAVMLSRLTLAFRFAISTATTVGFAAYVVFGLDNTATRLELALAQERARTEELMQRELSHQVAERSRELGAVLARSSASLDARPLLAGERFRTELGDSADPLIKALGLHGRQEDLGDVEPAAVLRRVMNFEALRQAARGSARARAARTAAGAWRSPARALGRGPGRPRRSTTAGLKH